MPVPAARRRCGRCPRSSCARRHAVEVPRARRGSRSRWRTTPSGRGRRSTRRAWPARGPRTARAPARPSRSAGPPGAGASSSSWRTVPTRHGTHCPHDSSRKNAAIRRSASARSTVSSNTRITPEPSVAPAARVPSNVSGTSSLSGPTNAPAAPPSRIAWIAPAAVTPPASSMRSRSVAAELDLVDAGPLDVARHAEQLRARWSPRCRSSRRPRRRRAGSAAR